MVWSSRKNGRKRVLCLLNVEPSRLVVVLPKEL